MKVEIYWIEGIPSGRLAIFPYPVGGDYLASQVHGLRESGVDVVVSLLGVDEAFDLGLEAEGGLCQQRGMRFISYPIPDWEVPKDSRHAEQVIDALAREAARGRAIAIHCRGGIGRSALIAAAVMVLQGETTDGAFERISAARGYKTPATEAQWQWVKAFEQRLGPRSGPGPRRSDPVQ